MDILYTKVKGILAAVDATKEKGVPAEFGVKGFPTIKYFKEGKMEYDVSGLREADKIVEFMKEPKVRHRFSSSSKKEDLVVLRMK